MARVKDAPVMENDDWQVQSDADTLSRAAEIVADKGRLAKAQAHFEKKSRGVEKLLTGLRSKA